MCAEANAQRVAQREATDKARRYRDAAQRLAQQLATAEQLEPTPANKKHARTVRRLYEQNLARAIEWEAKEQELSQ